MLPYGQFLGYEKGEDGLPKIVEKEAKVARLIYKMFLDGKTPSGKDDILATYDELIAKITDFKKQEKESRDINEECVFVETVLQKLIAENARSAMNQKEYNARYNTIASEYNDLQNRQHELSREMAIKKAKRNQMKAFIKELKQQKTLLTEFDESLWCATVSAVVVKSQKETLFKFKDGTELPWSI